MCICAWIENARQLHTVLTSKLRHPSCYWVSEHWVAFLKTKSDMIRDREHGLFKGQGSVLMLLLGDCWPCATNWCHAPHPGSLRAKVASVPSISSARASTIFWRSAPLPTLPPFPDDKHRCWIPSFKGYLWWWLECDLYLIWQASICHFRFYVGNYQCHGHCLMVMLPLGVTRMHLRELASEKPLVQMLHHGTSWSASISFILLWYRNWNRIRFAENPRANSELQIPQVMQ